MKEGAFALIDCLGFKGIWRRTDPSRLLKKLLAIEQVVQTRVTDDSDTFNRLSFGPIKSHVQLLSDTVAISLQYEDRHDKKPTAWQKSLLISVICQSVIKVLDLFITDEPPLVLRGCITYGEHVSDSNFIIGPAVDTAAEHMELSEGAFIWLHPYAADMYKTYSERMSELLSRLPPGVLTMMLKRTDNFQGRLSGLQNLISKDGEESVSESFLEVLRPLSSVPYVIVDYNMPLKTGASLRCTIINPLALKASSEEREATIKLYSHVISGNRMDIWLKRQHTLDMLTRANQVSEQFEKTIVALKPESHH